MKSTIFNLKNEISAAIEEEAKSESLTNNLRQHVDNLHAAIAISSNSPDAALIRFVSDYVDSLPDHLLAFHELAKEAHVSEYIQPFLNLACTYFLNPPDILNTFSGLQNIFYRTYLCQRILEELNDQVMSLSGVALAPLDVSMANIICHEIIGDDLANQLDLLVLLSIETANNDKGVFEKDGVKDFMVQRKNDDWKEVLERWPCFTRSYAIDLRLRDH